MVRSNLKGGKEMKHSFIMLIKLLYKNELFRILIEAIEIFDVDKHEVQKGSGVFNKEI